MELALLAHTFLQCGGVLAGSAHPLDRAHKVLVHVAVEFVRRAEHPNLLVDEMLQKMSLGKALLILLLLMLLLLLLLLLLVEVSATTTPAARPLRHY